MRSVRLWFFTALDDLAAAQAEDTKFFQQTPSMKVCLKTDCDHRHFESHPAPQEKARTEESMGNYLIVRRSSRLQKESCAEANLDGTFANTFGVAPMSSDLDYGPGPSMQQRQ